MWLRKDRLQSIAADIFDMIAFLIFVWGIVLFIRFFIANPYTVVGASMSPTFEENDFIIVDKITPRVGEWARWDIIVFVPPGKTVPYIKRIIWLPGETVKVTNGWVQICKDNECNILEETYLPEWLKTEAKCGLSQFEIDDTGFFVMGDNRWFTTDSLCCFGIWCYEWANYLVPYDHIIGKVYVRLIPRFWVF